MIALVLASMHNSSHRRVVELYWSHNRVIFVSRSPRQFPGKSTIHTTTRTSICCWLRARMLFNRPPGSRPLCQLSMTPQTFCPGGCIWARGAGSLASSMSMHTPVLVIASTVVVLD